MNEVIVINIYFNLVFIFKIVIILKLSEPQTHEKV